MEAWQKELIRKNFSELIKDTKCTSEFLNFFYEKGILGSDECQRIAGKETDAEKNVEFYKTIETRVNAFQILKDGLEKYLQSGARSLLESSSSSTAKKDISFDEVPPVHSFTGRTKELEQLHQMVLRSQGAERVAVVSQVTSVSGLGGIGKTELAREYVRLKGNEFDGNVLWMNAESEESLTTSFQRFAKEKLKLPTKDVNGREIPAKCIAEAVYKYFEGDKALFVFDNAEKAPWLRQIMPKVAQRPALFILITSREREWDRGMEVLQLDGLTEEDSVKLIQQGLDIGGKDAVQMEDLKMLAQTLECFPLALQQAIAYIYEQQITSDYTIKDYLKEFEREQQELLGYIEKDGICDPIFTTTTATTWSITFEKIKKDTDNGPLASLILNIVAYLGAENIKREMFYLIPSVKSDAQFSSVNSKQINEAVRLLVRYSMLNGREKQSVLSIHRLVQSVTQHQLAREGKVEYFLELSIQLLQGSDENDFPAENIAHALIVWRHAFKSTPIIHGYAIQVYLILWKIKVVGHHNEGIRFGNEALETFKAVLGDDHKDILWTQRSVALILQSQGYFEKALPIIQHNHSKANAIFGENSELSMETMEDLGNALRESGNYKKAQQILRKVLDKKKTIYGDNHESALMAEESYGLALLKEGKLSEAEEIFQRLFKVYIEKDGGNSTSLLRLQINLSVIYSKTGNYEKALEIVRKVYGKLTPVWVENVELFACVCYNLGDWLIAIGKFEEALNILEGNIDKIKQYLGSKHFRILVIQQQIGTAYQGLNNYSRALEIHQSVHQDFVLLSGEDSLYALVANREAAVALSMLENHVEALPKFQENTTKMESIFGNENWNVIISKWKYAEAIERSGENFPMALDLLLSIKQSMMCFVGEELTPEREASLTDDFIRILNKIGDLENDKQILQDILPKAKLLLDGDCEFSLEAKEELGYTFLQNGKFKEAEQIFKDVFTKKEQLFGKDHLSTLRCKANYGIALMNNENLDEAYEVFQLISEICSQKDAENDTDYWKLQNNLACIYLNKGQFGKSLEIYREVYKKINPVWNKHIHLFASVCYNFGETLNVVGKHEEALAILEGNVIKIKERSKIEPATILDIQQEIGYTYQSLGKFKKAYEILQSVHQSFIFLFGEDSLDVVETLYNVAMSLFELGEHAKAFSNFRDVLPRLEALLGKEDLGLIIKKRDFALAIARSGENLQTALDFLKRVRTSLSSMIGEDSEHVKTISIHIKAIEKTIKDFDEATSILQDYLPRAQSQYGEDTEPFLEIKESLGNTLIRNGKNAEAQIILGEVLEVREILFGEDHSLTLATRVSYGMALMDDGKLEQAQDIFQKISQFYLERGDENNKNMLRSHICLDLISIRKEVFDNKT